MIFVSHVIYLRKHTLICKFHIAVKSLVIVDGIFPAFADYICFMRALYIQAVDAVKIPILYICFGDNGTDIVYARQVRIENKFI